MYRLKIEVRELFFLDLSCREIKKGLSEDCSGSKVGLKSITALFRSQYRQLDQQLDPGLVVFYGRSLVSPEQPQGHQFRFYVVFSVFLDFQLCQGPFFCEYPAGRLDSKIWFISYNCPINLESLMLNNNMLIKIVLDNTRCDTCTTGSRNLMFANWRNSPSEKNILWKKSTHKLKTRNFKIVKSLEMSINAFRADVSCQ